MIKAKVDFPIGYSTIGIALVLMMLAVGCSVAPHPALEQARTTYTQAQQNPEIATHAPVALREAEETLIRAEQAWEEDQDQEEVRHLVYVVEQKVEIARATAQRKMAEAEVDELSGAREQVVLEARTREAELARQRARELEQELAELKATETERGLVLTLGDVLFEFARADLKPGSMRNLFPVVAFLRENPTRNVLIEGHTDSIGSAAYNLELSQRRAEAVRTFLVQQGIDPARVMARGYGEDYPVAPNTTEAGRQRNRRVEVIILREGETAADRIR